MTERTDLSVVKLSAEDYYNDVLDEKTLSNVLYIVEDDKINAYGQQIKHVADPTEFDDAANKTYVDESFFTNLQTLGSQDMGYSFAIGCNSCINNSLSSFAIGYCAYNS